MEIEKDLRYTIIRLIDVVARLEFEIAKLHSMGRPANLQVARNILDSLYICRIGEDTE